MRERVEWRERSEKVRGRRTFLPRGLPPLLPFAPLPSFPKAPFVVPKGIFLPAGFFAVILPMVFPLRRAYCAADDFSQLRFRAAIEINPLQLMKTRRVGRQLSPRARRTPGERQKTPHGLVGVVRAASDSPRGLNARRARREPGTRFAEFGVASRGTTVVEEIWLAAWGALEGRESALLGKARTGTTPRCLS